MNPSLQLSIPQPCAENWAGMLPAERGRFCNACQKTVIDFTRMTDQEIITYFQSFSGSTCGRFSNEQLDRPIQPSRPVKRNWWKMGLYWGLPALLFFNKARTQGEPLLVPVEVKASDNKFLTGDTIPVPAIPVRTITGRVTGEGEPLTGASVVVAGTNTGVATDRNGYFSLSVSQKDPVVLKVSYVGYEARRLTVDTSGDKANEVNLLDLPRALSGEVVIVGYTARRPPAKTLWEQCKSLFTKDSISIYPNPVMAGQPLQLKMTVKTTGHYTVRLTNINGQSVCVKPVLVNSKQTHVQLETGSLPPGDYVATVFDPAQHLVHSQKFIIKN